MQNHVHHGFCVSVGCGENSWGNDGYDVKVPRLFLVCPRIRNKGPKGCIHYKEYLTWKLLQDEHDRYFF